MTKFLFSIQQSIQNNQNKIHPRGKAKMRSNSTNSINSKSTQSIAIQKISSFITRFHAVLLPKAKGSGVFRDLSEQQQFLLNNMDSENPLHSILAGCLAIDSCLSTICQAEQNLTDSILKGVTNLCAIWQKAQNQLIQSVQAHNLTLTKIEQICKKIEQSNRNMIRLCKQLPYSQQNQEIKKQDRIMSQQDITFKISSLKLFEENSEQNILKRNSNFRQLQVQNYRLQQQLSFTQKKVIQLQLKVSKLQDQKKQMSSQFKTEKQKNQRKYSQKTHQQIDVDKTSTWPYFNSPSTGSLTHEKEVQGLKDQIVAYQRRIQEIRQEFNNERKKLIREIWLLEEENKRNDVNQDTQLILILQELQDQIQALREERRKDERIIGLVQQQIEGMSISRQSRIRRGIRTRQSRLGVRHSEIYRQGGDVQYESRSPSFKRSRLRNRIYTKNSDISRSSISMPKMQQSSSYVFQKQRKIQGNSRLQKGESRQRYQRGYHQNPKQLRHSFMQNQFKRPSKARIPEHQQYQPGILDRHSNRLSDLNSVPLVESKLPKESMGVRAHEYIPNSSKIGAKQYDKGPSYPQARYETRWQTLPSDQNKGKASKWQQITNTENKGSQRLKTSRI